MSNAVTDFSERIVSIAARRGVAAAIILTAGLGSGAGSPAARVEATARAKGEDSKAPAVSLANWRRLKEFMGRLVIGC